MKLATVALASVFALSSTFAVAGQTRHKYTSGDKYTSGQKYKSSAKPYRGRSAWVPAGQVWVGMAVAQTTAEAWLAARTPVPTGPKSKRRVSAGLFCGPK